MWQADVARQGGERARRMWTVAHWTACSLHPELRWLVHFVGMGPMLLGLGDFINTRH